MNPADRFMNAFPNASESNGWSKKHLVDMVRDATKLGITGDEFQNLVDGLLRKPRRSSVPTYAEVYAAMEGRVRDRAGMATDPTVQRLRDHRENYTPPTPEQKAARRKWLEAFKAGDKAGMAAADRELEGR